MKRFFFSAEVTSTYGHQLYYVDAETEEDARAEFEKGDSTFVSEEIEVMDLGEVTLDSVEEVPSEVATPSTDASAGEGSAS